MADAVKRKDGSSDMERMCEGRIETGRKRLAKAICLLESARMEVGSACEMMGWNDEVAFTMDEAATKLGYALATLDTWDDGLEEGRRNGG